MINTTKSAGKNYKKEKEILEHNIEVGKNIVNSGKSYVNKNGDAFSTGHYKKGIEEDQRYLKDVKQKLKDQKMASRFKKAASSKTNEEKLKKRDQIKY